MKRHINLLPQRFLRRQLLVHRIKQWSAVLLCVAVLGSVVGGVRWNRLKTHEKSMDFLTQEYAPLEKMRQEVELIKTRIENVKRSEALVLGLADEDSMLSLVAIVSQAARYCEGNVTVRKFRVERGTTQRNGKNSSFRVLTLEGAGTDNISVARFANALAESKAFHDVQLRSTAAKGNSPVSTPQDERNYSIECLF